MFDKPSSAPPGPLPHAALLPCPPINREDVERSGIDVNQMLDRIQARWPDHIELVLPVDYFCGSKCPTLKDGIWLYRDGNHFTVAGSEYMVERADGPISAFLASTLARAKDDDPIMGRHAANRNTP
jgi:hypothetical protein